MSSVSLERLADDRAALQGELTFDSVPTLVTAIDGFLVDGGALTLDLSGVTRSDSAGVALLVSWERKVRANNMHLSYSAVPEQLLVLARVSGLEQMLSPSS